MEEAAACGVKLIVSVDTGIRANDVVRHASALGIDVIVTDHHLPEVRSRVAAGAGGAESQSAGLHLSGKKPVGAGVALKLVDALIRAWDGSLRGASGCWIRC